MKTLTPTMIRKRNLRALVAAFAALAVAAVLLSLPIYRFATELYTQKSPNTFIGDEKYLAARAEIDAIAQTYQDGKEPGVVEVSESVTTRVNSKGETASLVTFHVSTVAEKNAWDFIASGLPNGKLLLLCALALGASALLMLLSLPDSLLLPPHKLKRRVQGLRNCACALAALALLLIPIFHFYTVSLFQRQMIGASNQSAAPELTSLLTAADALLYGSQAGDTIGSLIAGLTYHSTVIYWLLLPALFGLLIAYILLARESLTRTLARGALYLFVIGICVVILYPYYVMVITAFRNNAEATDMYFLHLFPTKWVWSNITDIINRGVPRYLLNSLLLSGGATLIALGCGIPAAYAMARMNFRGKKVFLGFVIMSQMFAPIVLLVGISQLMNMLGLNDSIIGLMLINAAFNQAFAIWLLRGTFVSISPEMEQAARIDGCSTGRALINVLLPMAAPGIVTTLIFVFINAWNEYTISTVLISTSYKKPITVGITQFSSFNMIEWQYLFASALLATIPVVILFMFIEKHLVAGLTSGGVKG
jgi:multiple sugar transport system permease protein